LAIDLILDKKNEIKVAHFPKKHRFSPILFCKDNNKITKKKEIRSETGKKTDERVISGYKKSPCIFRYKGFIKNGDYLLSHCYAVPSA
jgi:hypothetical protein